MTALPPPANGTEIYLAAIHDRLGEIRDRLPTRAEEPAEGEPMELREPAPPPTAPARPLTEPARPARKPSARKTPSRAASRTQAKKGA